MVFVLGMGQAMDLVEGVVVDAGGTVAAVLIHGLRHTGVDAPQSLSPLTHTFLGNPNVRHGPDLSEVRARNHSANQGLYGHPRARNHFQEDSNVE